MKKLLGLVFLGSILFIIGCSTVVEKSESELEEECEAKNGQLIRCFTSTGYTCSLPTKDGGKPCSDSDECEQECVAPTNCESIKTNVKGTCAERTGLVCNGVQTFENGRCGPHIIA